MKHAGLILALFLLISASAAEASYQQYRPVDKGGNPFKVFGRGVVNLVGTPLELGTGLVRETEMHSRLWPVTYPPRMIHNLFYRTFSAANDVFILPWVAPFTKDTEPWTEGMGLPKYPWNVK